MYQHKPRRFRHRSNGRSHQTRNKEGATVRLESGIFSNGGLKILLEISEINQSLEEINVGCKFFLKKKVIFLSWHKPILLVDMFVECLVFLNIYFHP